MNDENEKCKGWIYIERLLSCCRDEAFFYQTIKEFSMESMESRLTVALSFLEIGADRSETRFDRNLALSQLAMLIRICGLKNDADYQKRLINIIDDWLLDSAEQIVPWGALWALGRINPTLGLEKCDQLINYYGDSTAGLEVYKIRDGIMRLNVTEN